MVRFLFDKMEGVYVLKKWKKCMDVGYAFYIVQWRRYGGVCDVGGGVEIEFHMVEVVCAGKNENEWKVIM